MTIGIIPARMASTRFPGKPLADICGIPMVGHCYFRSKMAASLDDVYIATCDEEIMKYAESVEAPCVMTSPDHERASDRVAEALHKAEEETQSRHDIVVLIQGDEPMIHPDMIDATVQAMQADSSIQVANGYAEILSNEEFIDPNEIKVVLTDSGNALYFSRSPIPSTAKWDGEVKNFKQVCIIPFRRDYLLAYNSTPQTPLEQVESIDMLRVLETGEQVRMVAMSHETYSVDTPDDLAKVIDYMKSDPLRHQYA